MAQTFSKIVLTAVLTLGATSFAISDENDIDPSTVSKIEELASAFPKIDKVLHDLEVAPSNAWLVKDRGDYQAKLNGLIDSAFDLILPDTYAKFKEELKVIESHGSNLKIKISRLKIKRQTAPNIARSEKRYSLDYINPFLEPAKQEIDKEIINLGRELDSTESEKQETLRNFSKALETKFNVRLNNQEAYAALHQVNGESIVNAHLVTSTLVNIERRMKEILSLKLEPDVVRPYYGVALLSRLIIYRMHEKALTDYDVKWLPKLAELKEDAQKRLVISEDRLRNSPTYGEKEAVEANIRVDQKAIDVIDSYAATLRFRRDETRKLAKAAKRSADIALQTYRTYEGAVTLDELIATSALEFDMLVSIKPPDLLPLKDDEMFKQFIDLSQKLERS